jgi:hypothetical protein
VLINLCMCVGCCALACCKIVPVFGNVQLHAATTSPQTSGIFSNITEPFNYGIYIKLQSFIFYESFSHVTQGLRFWLSLLLLMVILRSPMFLLLE